MQLDRNIPRVFEDSVLHIGVYDRIARVIPAADAEHDANFRKYLNHKNKRDTMISNEYSPDRHFANAVRHSRLSSLITADNSIYQIKRYVFRVTVRN